MISQDTIQKIQRLKARRFTQENVAQQLGLSRSTVARHWGGRKGISVEEEVSTVMAALKYYFEIGKCPDCGITYPRPKFLPEFKCPKCKTTWVWEKCFYE